jgi:putative membrane protein
VRILRWRLVRVVGHPVSAAVLSVGGLFVVMLTPLYSALERYPLVHQGVHLHYLAAGYLFVCPGQTSVRAGRESADEPESWH